MLRKVFKHQHGWILSGGSVLVLFALVNFLAAPISGTRLDLTEERLHTLSDGTRNMLGDLENKVTLNFYFSKELSSAAPAFGNYAKRVRDMLNEMKLAGGGKVVIKEQDPVAFSEIEDEAVEAGLQGAPLDQSGDQAYFGLQVKSGEESSVIPFFQSQREKFLEYDLARMIHAVSSSNKKIITIYTGRPLFGDMRRMMAGLPTEAYRIVPELRKRFEVNHMFSLRDLPFEKPDVLIIVHPLKLEMDEKYELDQFLLRGGKAIFILDPFNETAAGTSMPQGQKPTLNSVSNVQEFLDRWGITISGQFIAADRSIARMVNAGTTTRILPAPFVTWLAVPASLMSRNDPVTSELRLLNLQSAGIIDVTKIPGIEVEPLVRTTKDSQKVDVKTHKGRVDVESMAANFKPSGKELILATRISGKFASIFPDGPPEIVEDKVKKNKLGNTSKPAPTAKDTNVEAKTAAEEEEKKRDREKKIASHLKTSEKPFNVLLVSDADFLENHFWVQVRQFLGQNVLVPTSNNADFVINAVDHFTGNADLISLRSRGTTRRPFSKVNEIRREAEIKYRKAEQNLASKLKMTEKKLGELRDRQDEKTETNNSDRKKTIEIEIKQALNELIVTRKELRNVRLKLNEDISRLETWIRFANIAFMPILVGTFAVGLGVYRTRRRRKNLGTDDNMNQKYAFN
ncbi:MAG: Gldg family protein [Pseudomonadota bacterium]|nr:Gldg family protein [Pseudomonadota bacterium]